MAPPPPMPAPATSSMAPAASSMAPAAASSFLTIDVTGRTNNRLFRAFPFRPIQKNHDCALLHRTASKIFITDKKGFCLISTKILIVEHFLIHRTQKNLVCELVRTASKNLILLFIDKKVIWINIDKCDSVKRRLKVIVEHVKNIKLQCLIATCKIVRQKVQRSIE